MNEKILQLNWTKRWASRFSLLSCSYWGLQYTKIAKRELGKGFKNVLFTHKDGITTCYRVKEETTDFGKYLADKAIQNNELLTEWSENLKKQADKIRTLISEPTENFLNPHKFSLFEKEFDMYYPFAGANNTVSDFLPSDLFEKYKGVLEDARKYSESVYNETEDFFGRLIKHIAEKETYNPKSLLTIFRDELIKYLAGGILPNQGILESRYKRSALFFDELGMHFISEDEAELLETSIINQSKVTKKEIRGKTACLGKVTGTVRIIKDPKNFGIFNDGDILVTGMTRPDFVPLMKKAGAVVTDAGGILSHAAIVSRELNKPCIIGTEVATNILKDGDMVEVDADRGIVRIIK